MGEVAQAQAGACAVHGGVLVGVRFRHGTVVVGGPLGHHVFAAGVDRYVRPHANEWKSEPLPRLYTNNLPTRKF